MLPVTFCITTVQDRCMAITAGIAEVPAQRTALAAA